MTLLTELDEHYKNLNININTSLADSLDTFIVTEPVLINLECTPRDYRLSFDLCGRGSAEKAQDQIITYLHKAQRPVAQY